MGAPSRGGSFLSGRPSQCGARPVGLAGLPNFFRRGCAKLAATSSHATAGPADHWVIRLHRLPVAGARRARTHAADSPDMAYGPFGGQEVVVVGKLVLIHLVLVVGVAMAEVNSPPPLERPKPLPAS